jgi:asparagine synthase (glutamine-hydrolysing)
MSSIFGKCNFDSQPVTAGELKLMQDELNHWKADDVNTWVRETAGLGHLMLYNTPESLNEKLPLHDIVSQLTITADARIDNVDELCSLMRLNTPDERKIPDSTIILLLYKKYGESCVNYLVGDFAFAIWDEKEQKLFCVRDQMGVKPFFYYHSDRFFAFASEKKGLLCLPGIDKSIDKQFYYNQVFSPKVQAADTTLYKHIRRLPPAHTLTWHRAKAQLKLQRYWTLDPYKELKLSSKEDYYEGLRAHLEMAVQCRLRSHYPTGAELSGGMDSSAITGIASSFMKKTGSNIITFSNMLSESDKLKEPHILHEGTFIDSVVKFNGIENAIMLTEDFWENPLDEADFMLRVNDGLEMWSMAWEIPVKSAAMQQNVRALLSGFPGDEMVTYRGQFYFLDYLDHKQYLKYFLAKNKMPFKKFKPFVPPGLEFYLHKVKNFLTMNSRKNRLASDLLIIPISSRYTRGDVVWQDENFRERFKSHRHYQKYRLLKPQVALRMESETRLGLSFRTEPRFPMADIRLTQFYLSIPNSIKSEGEQSRSAYRAAMNRYLPEAVLKRDSKKGNIAPFKSTSEMKDRFRENIELFLKSLNNRGKNYSALIYLSKKNKDNMFIMLEFLRWFEKNSGDL